MRRCTKCHESKPLAAFPSRAGMRDGYGSWCRACQARATQETRDRYPARYAEKQVARGASPLFDLRVLGDGFRFEEIARADRGEYLWALKIDPCAYCGRVPKLLHVNGCGKRILDGELDHIQPIRARGRRPASRNPTKQWANLTGCCAACNGAKGTMSLLAFLLARDAMLVGSPAGEPVAVRTRVPEVLGV